VFTAILLGLTVEPSFGVTLDTKLGPFLHELPEEIRNTRAGPSSCATS